MPDHAQAASAPKSSIPPPSAAEPPKQSAPGIDFFHHNDEDDGLEDLTAQANTADNKQGFNKSITKEALRETHQEIQADL